VAHARLGWAEGEQASRFASLIRDSTTPEALQLLLKSVGEFDVTALLPLVTPATLVLHRRQVPLPDVGLARGLASRIPDARLAVLEGDSIFPMMGDTDAVFRAIDEFLGEGEEAAAGAEPPEAGAFRTVLFTDVEGSTAFTQRLGDAKARELLREHERIVREALKAHGGSEVKTMGDGFMASFSSATKALECAIAMQRAFAEQNESAEEPIKVRVGLNAGEPIAEDEDLFGTAVNLAARICAHAESGQILAPIVVRELAAGKQFLLADLGETELRGFEDPVRLYEVSWRETS
jgi:class 3 adenylate cyclase